MTDTKLHPKKIRLYKRLRRKLYEWDAAHGGAYQLDNIRDQLEVLYDEGYYGCDDES